MNYFITQIISYSYRQLFLTMVDRIHIVNVTERPQYPRQKSVPELWNENLTWNVAQYSDRSVNMEIRSKQKRESGKSINMK
jgi:hypothetical protein